MYKDVNIGFEGWKPTTLLPPTENAAHQIILSQVQQRKNSSPIIPEHWSRITENYYYLENHNLPLQKSMRYSRWMQKKWSVLRFCMPLFAIELRLSTSTCGGWSPQRSRWKRKLNFPIFIFLKIVIHFETLKLLILWN